MRTVFTADSFTVSLDSLEGSAPADIAADQEAVSEWFRTRWSDVIGDFDVRRIWLDGTPEDRAVFTLFHPDVVEHDSRLTAYEEQLCTHSGVYVGSRSIFADAGFVEVSHPKLRRS